MFKIQKLKPDDIGQQCDMCEKPLKPESLIYTYAGYLFCSKKCANNHKNLSHKKVRR